ncbi:BAR domain-containing protein [Blastocladiella emersonii ATCC 22665]|nr:BAR domain-containing protein [Blastocladiella emersonii ATCC 22665]
MDSFFLKLNGLASQVTPLAKTVERGFGQARQFAQEKMGTAEDLTELPVEYLELERKVDSIQSLLTALLKSHAGSSFVPAAVSDTVSDLTNTIRATAVPVLAQAPLVGGAVSSVAAPGPAAPATSAHAVARACQAPSDALGQEPLGAAVRKLGASEEKLGDAEVALKETTSVKFVQPISAIVNDRLANVSRARRTVTNTRLQLDSVKSRFKSASPQRAEALQVELEKAEDVFVDAVEEATKLMKAVVDSPAVLRHTSDLVAAQLAYHKQCVQILSDLAPEVDELQMTQEALYSTSQMS